MIEVDRRMMEQVDISLFQMMENASLQLANVARDVFLGGDVDSTMITVNGSISAGGNGILVAGGVGGDADDGGAGGWGGNRSEKGQGACFTLAGGNTSCASDGSSGAHGAGGIGGAAGGAGGSPWSGGWGLAGNPGRDGANGSLGEIIDAAEAGAQGVGGDVRDNTILNLGSIVALGNGVYIEGGLGSVNGQAINNRVMNGIAGLISGDAGVHFGEGTDNYFSNADTLTGTGGVALNFTSGSNEAVFLHAPVTNGSVDGGIGDDLFVLNNNATIAGMIAGNGAGDNDTLRLDFRRILPSEVAALEAIVAGNGAFNFRFEDYTYTDIENIDLSNLHMSDFSQRATWENQIALGLALDNLPFVTPELDSILYLVDEVAPDMNLALRQLTPELYDLARVGQFGLMRHWNRSIRTGSGGATLVADELAGNRVWFDGLGALLSQSDGSEDHPAYSALARAQRIGADFNIGPSTSIGVVFGHSTTSADADSYSDAPDSYLGSESYFGMIYGTHTFGNGMVLVGQVQYGQDSYTASRQIMISDEWRTAMAEFGGEHAGISGRLSWGGFEWNGWHLKPDTGLSYMYYAATGLMKPMRVMLTWHLRPTQPTRLKSRSVPAPAVALF